MVSEPRRRSRILFAIAMGMGLTALYVLGLYLFFAWLWPLLPGWAMAIAFVLLAVFAIGSPIAALARIGRGLDRRGPGDRDSGKL